MTADDKEELERLCRQLEEVTAERDRLLAENRRLRRDYSISPQESVQVSLPFASMGTSSLPITGEPSHYWFKSILLRQ